MKNYSEIIRGFGLFLLLFVLVSAVAVSEDTYEISVTIVQNSSSEDDANTVISTDTTESEFTETSVIFGSGSSEITNEEDAIPAESNDSVDSNANGNPNPGIMPPNSNPDGLTYEKWSAAKWLEWVLSSVTSEDIMLPPLPTIEDTTDFTTTGNPQ